MSTKPKTAAAKKPAKLAPLRFAGGTCQSMGPATIRHMLRGMTSKELKCLLSERSIPIPKDKEEMVSRMAEWCVRSEGLFSLTLS